MDKIITEDKHLKELLKSAIIEVFEERKSLLAELVVEVLEERALVKAIKEGEKTEKVSRKEVFEILDGI
ncbi:MAG: hypothetical protein DWQ06_04550 [Calditrichaeota bacterium]|nr:MAG: hypothetical protein DWQ06_04550 [Calditrichota bacterium]